MGIELIVLACAVVLLTLWASWIVMADQFTNPWQKAAQLLLVWCIPILGPLVVFGVHRSAEKPSRTYRERAESPDDFVGYGAAARRSNESADGD